MQTTSRILTERSAVNPVSRPLRIANFTFSYAPLMTGISAGVHDRVVQLLQWGHEIHLVRPQVDSPTGNGANHNGAYGLHELEEFPNFSTTAFPTKRHPFRPSHPEPKHHRYWSDTRILEEFRPDLILVDDAAALYGLSSLGLGGYGRPVGSQFAAQSGVPVFNLMQTDWISYAEQMAGRLLTRCFLPYIRRKTRRFFEGYTRSLSPSAYLQQRYRDYYNTPIHHVRFHGVNCAQYCPENIRFDPIPEFAGPVLLFTGRIAPEKSVHRLLEAFETVHRAVPDARLYCLGSGPSLRRLRRKAVRRFGDAAAFPGEFHGDELKGWYARADVYWTASVTENFCTAILEALASGTPLVASAAGGNVEQIKDGVCGFLVAPDSPREMAERTIELLTDDRLRTRMSRGAREAGLSFDNAVTTAELLEFAAPLIGATAACESVAP